MKSNAHSDKIFIIAEAGVNHNGSFNLAKRLVDEAVKSGADAVKFQAFRADELVCIDAPKAEYQKKTTGLSESQYQMLKSLELNEEEQKELYDYCQLKRITFMSSPFDLKSVKFLTQTLDLPIIKVASGEITNIPLLFNLAQTQKSVILSTGMCSLGEIEHALGALAFGYLSSSNNPPHHSECEKAYCSSEGQNFLKEKVSLLHCTSEYPAPLQEVNLRVISTLEQAFNLPVGYSDHTLGIAIPIAAAACGAKIIEKHFTLDTTMTGPDHQASLSPDELALMIKGIRQVEIALGTEKKIPTPSELKNRLIARKSLVSLEKIKTGEFFTEKNVGCKRPGNGMAPGYFTHVLGKPATRDYEKDEMIFL